MKLQELLDFFIQAIRLQVKAHDMSAINRYAETQAFGRPLTTEEVDRAVERDRDQSKGVDDEA